ncbi:MAG: hypothetical protein AAB653_01620, partial [Patescibacteria group bacterium]
PKKPLEANLKAKENKKEFVAKALKKILKKIHEFTFPETSEEEIQKLKKERQRHKEFKKKFRENWGKMGFTVHGEVKEDKKTGKIIFLKKTGEDEDACLHLLKLAHFNVNKLFYTHSGEPIKTTINFGTSDVNGVTYEIEKDENGEIKKDENGEKIITAHIDHHDKESTAESACTAKILYRILIEEGLLEKNPALDKLIQFISYIDRDKFPSKGMKGKTLEKAEEQRQNFENSYNTILGLHRFMPFKQRLEYFSDKIKKHLSEGKPIEELTTTSLATTLLSDTELIKYRLRFADGKGRVEQQKDVIEQSKERLKMLEEKGRVIDTPFFGRIVIDEIGEDREKIAGGWFAVQSLGYDGLVIYNKKANNFFITVKKGGLFEFKLDQGMPIRDTMYMKPMEDREEKAKPLTVSLEEIMEALKNFNAIAEIKNTDPLLLTHTKYLLPVEIKLEKKEKGKVKDGELPTAEKKYEERMEEIKKYIEKVLKLKPGFNDKSLEEKDKIIEEEFNRQLKKYKASNLDERRE